MGVLRYTYGSVIDIFMVASNLTSGGYKEQNVSIKGCYKNIHNLVTQFEKNSTSFMCDQLLTCHQHKRHEKLCTSYIECDTVIKEVRQQKE